MNIESGGALMSVSGLLKSLYHYNSYLNPKNHPDGVGKPLRLVDFTYTNIRINPDEAEFADFEEGFDFTIWEEIDKGSVWPDNTILTEETEDGKDNKSQESSSHR